MIKSNRKLKISMDQILQCYFQAYRPRVDVDEIKFRQIRTDKYLSEFDASEIVNRLYSSLNMFLGANCSGCEDLDFNAVKWLFLDARRYSKENLAQINTLNDVAETNLSDNDFSNYVWDFDKFLSKVGESVLEYVEPSYYHRFIEASEYDEYEFVNNGILGDECASVTKEMNERIKQIMKITIPNLKNTKLHIKIDMSKLYMDYERAVVKEILQSQKFDGCYVSVYNCSPEFIETFGITNRKQLYYYPTKGFTKQKI